MLVIKINKELSTEECIKYGKQLSEHLGEKVVILDNKVKEFYRLDEQKIFIRELPYPKYPYQPYYFDGVPYVLCDNLTSAVDSDCTTTNNYIKSACMYTL